VHAAAPTFIDIDPEPAVVSFAPAPEPGDVMPANPAEEVPLFDKPFVDPNPLQRALEAKNGPRRRHPGMAAEPLAAELPPAPVPSFDFADAEPVTIEPIADDRPLPPLSSLDDPSVGPLPQRPSEPIGVATTDRNTFIAAARRAAMRQSGSAAASTGPAAGNSLIARAFARFQATRAADAAAKATTPVPPPSSHPCRPRPKSRRRRPRSQRSPQGDTKVEAQDREAFQGGKAEERWRLQARSPRVGWRQGAHRRLGAR
jgi:localization factor PodJL